MLPFDMAPSDILTKDFDPIKSAREQAEQFRRDLERHVEPHVENARVDDTAAIAIVQTVLKTGTLLNGGAIIALPAVVSLFALQPRDVIWSGVPFAGGLVASWLAAFCAFFALGRRSDAWHSYAAAARIRVTQNHYPTDDPAATLDEAARHYRIGKLRFRWFVAIAWVGIMFCAISLAAFVYGGLHGAQVVLRAPPKSSATVTADPHLPPSPKPP